MDERKDIYYVTYWAGHRIFGIFMESGPFCVREREAAIAAIQWAHNADVVITAWVKLTPEEIQANWKEICTDGKRLTP